MKILLGRMRTCLIMFARRQLPDNLPLDFYPPTAEYDRRLEIRLRLGEIGGQRIFARFNLVFANSAP